MADAKLWYLVRFRDEKAQVVETDMHPTKSMPNWSGCSVAYDSFDALKAGEELGYCSICAQPYGVTYTEDVASVMRAKNICFTCWFWTEHVTPAHNGVVVDGTHYTVGPEATQRHSFRGHGGRLFVIRSLKDGAVTRTTNLWCQGTIPVHFRNRYPDNAEFIGDEQVQRLQPPRGHLQVIDAYGGLVTVRTTCPSCTGTQVFNIFGDGYTAWCNGAHIQNALPHSSPEQREMLLTGLCATCWNKAFVGGDDE